MYKAVGKHAVGWSRSGAGALASVVLLTLAGCSLDRSPSGGGVSAAVGGSLTDGGSSSTSGFGASTGGGISGTSAGASVGGTGFSGLIAGTGAINTSDGGPLVGSVDEKDGGMPTVTCASTASKTGMCRPLTEGVYALESDLDVWWKDEVNNPMAPLLDPGRGHIVIDFMTTISNVCDDGSAGVTEIRTCGAKLPPFFVDAVCKVVQIEFPPSIWDAADMPRYITRASVTGFDPGDLLQVSTVTGLLGIELPAIDAPWPSYTTTGTFACPSGTGKDCFPDQDLDGRPGVTVEINPGGTVTDAPYACGAGSAWQKSSAPLSVGSAAFNLQGATRVHIGLRMALGGEGKIGAACLDGTGTGSASPDIPVRVFSCVVEDGNDCTAADANFVDQNVPHYRLLAKDQKPPDPPDWQHPREFPTSPFIPKVTLDRSPSVGPRTRMVRLGDVGSGVTCEQVRNAAFPPFE